MDVKPKNRSPIFKKLRGRRKKDDDRQMVNKTICIRKKVPVDSCAGYDDEDHSNTEPTGSYHGSSTNGFTVTPSKDASTCVDYEYEDMDGKLNGSTDEKAGPEGSKNQILTSSFSSIDRCTTDSAVDYEYETIDDKYDCSPVKSDTSVDSEGGSGPSVDGSLKELFSSVNSLLTSRETFTLMEGTTLETELNRLKRMGRRRSLTHCSSTSMEEGPPPMDTRRRRNSVSNCGIGSFPSTGTPPPVPLHPSSLLGDISRPWEQQQQALDASSTERSEMEYFAQKRKIRGYLKDNRPIPHSPMPRRLSNEPYAPEFMNSDDSFTSQSSALSPLTVFSESSAAAARSPNTSVVSMSSVSLSLDEPRMIKPIPQRTQAMTGINMQRVFGASEEAAKRMSSPGLLDIRSDIAPRKPGRRRSINM